MQKAGGAIGPLVRVELDCTFDELHGFYLELAEKFYAAAHPEAGKLPQGVATCIVHNLEALHEDIVPQEPCFIEVKGSKLSIEELRGQPLLVITHERFRSAYPIKELQTPAAANHQNAIRAALDVLTKHNVIHRVFDAAKEEVPA